MNALDRYRAHIDRIRALRGDEPDETWSAIYLVEANALDPASNVELRDSIPRDEWPAWSEAMKAQREAVSAFDRRRTLHRATAAAHALVDAANGLARRVIAAHMEAPCLL